MEIIDIMENPSNLTEEAIDLNLKSIICMLVVIDTIIIVIGPAGQQTYRAYVLNIPTAATTATTTTAIFPNLKTKIVIT